MKQIHVYVKEEQQEKLMKKSDETGVAMSAIVRMALSQYFGGS